MKQNCQVCKAQKKCINIRLNGQKVRKCQSCLTAEDKQWLYDQKKEKTAGYKKIDKVRKPSGELAVFDAIWKTRKHICFITGEPIPEPYVVDNFMHVLPKGQYPAWRLNPRNIVLGLTRVHRDEHSVARSVLEDRVGVEGIGWMNYFALKEELKKEYDGEKQIKSNIK